MSREASKYAKLERYFNLKRQEQTNQKSLWFQDQTFWKRTICTEAARYTQIMLRAVYDTVVWGAHAIQGK
jgi:hypothetical protein